MAQVQYDNFDLQILSTGSGYEARVIASPAGKGKCSFAVPFTPEELEHLTPYPNRDSREIELKERLEYRNQNHKAFGQKLFQTVFSEDVRRLFDRSLATVKGEEKGLRILLRLDAVPDLARWPWEYLSDPSDGFLQFSRPTPIVIVRYSEVSKEAEPLAVSPPLKILVVISKPNDARVLDVEGEWTKLKEALSNLENKGQVQLERLEQATLGNLRQKNRTFQPHVLHYIGHGTFKDEGSLVLEKEDGSSDLVSGQDLIVQLGNNRYLKLALLNACQGAKASETDPYVGIAQQLLKSGIPAAIAMQYAIGDAAAKTFASEFYTALADSNYPIDAALTEARRALFDKYQMEWGTPVLFMRSPDGGLLVIPADATQEQKVNLRTTINPYKGLQAFHEEDATFFFGREEATEELVQAVEKNSFVAVVGASGSGKSSVVRAGLVPRSRQGAAHKTWEIITMVPGKEPFKALAAELIPLLEPDLSTIDRLSKVNQVRELLTSPSMGLKDLMGEVLKKQQGTERLMLIVDQWEELYTLSSSDEAKRFIDELLKTTQDAPLSVVLTLRGDFYGRALGYRPLSDRLQNGVVNLGPMTREELERAIVEPAKKVGLSFEPGLVEKILDDVGDEPGNLPLLEFTLSELWKKQRDGQLLFDVYKEMGGVQGAIAQRADALFSKFSDLEKQAAQRIFLQLVKLDEDHSGTVTRRRATYGDISEAAQSVVQRLAERDARLLVTGRDEASEEETIEVSHEALIQNWPTLKEWVNQDRAFLLWHQRLRSDLEDWEKNQQTPNYLLTGGPLVEAERWLTERPEELNPNERQFVQDSIRQRQQQEFEEQSKQTERNELLENQTRLQKRSIRNLRLFLITIFAALVVAGFVVFRLIKVTNEKLYTEQLTRGRMFVAQGKSIFQENPEFGIALALEGLYTVYDISQSQSDDLLSLDREIRLLIKSKIEHEMANEITGFLPFADNTKVFIFRKSGPSEIRDLNTGVILKELDRKAIKVTSIAQSNALLIKYSDSDYELRSFPDELVVARFYEPISSIQLSSDLKWAIINGNDFRNLHDFVRKPVSANLVDLDANQIPITFSPNTQWIAVDYENKNGELQRLGDIQMQVPLSGNIQNIEFSPDSEWYVVGYEDRCCELRRLDDSLEPIPFKGNSAIPFKENNAIFSFDSKWVIGDGDLRDLNEPLHHKAVGLLDYGSFSFSRDSKWLFGRGQLIKLGPEIKPYNILSPEYHENKGHRFSPNSKWLIHSTKLFNLDKDPIMPIDGIINHFSGSLEFSPDSEWLIDQL